MATQPARVTDPLQLAADDVVTSWPDVKGKQVFGHRGWIRGGKMFGFLADVGAAVKVTAAMDGDEIMARDGVLSFTYNDMPMKGWAVLPLRDDSDLDAAVELLRQAFETVGR